MIKVIIIRVTLHVTWSSDSVQYDFWKSCKSYEAAEPLGQKLSSVACDQQRSQCEADSGNCTQANEADSTVNIQAMKASVDMPAHHCMLCCHLLEGSITLLDYSKHLFSGFTTESKDIFLLLNCCL